MNKCDKDCLNCKLEHCRYDTHSGTINRVVRGKTEGFYQRLAQILEKRDYTQKRLALETGITQPTISAYINDLRKPRADHIVVICQTLHCSADWLLGIK